MAEANGTNGNSVAIKTALGEIAAKGSTVVLLVILIALGGLALWEHKKRADEHGRLEAVVRAMSEAEIKALEKNDCYNRLAIYQGLQPRGTVNWEDMPIDLYSCMPEFMKGRK